MNTEERIKELENKIKELEAENERIKLHSNLVDIEIGLLIEGLKVVDRLINS